MPTNRVTRDNSGMYARSSDGPDPSLMGANTLLGNDVQNKDAEECKAEDLAAAKLEGRKVENTR